MPPQNRQLNVLISNSTQHVDDFVGDLTLLNHSMNALSDMKLDGWLAEAGWQSRLPLVAKHRHWLLGSVLDAFRRVFYVFPSPFPHCPLPPSLPPPLALSLLSVCLSICLSVAFSLSLFLSLSLVLPLFRVFYKDSDVSRRRAGSGCSWVVRLHAGLEGRGYARGGMGPGVCER